MDQQPTTPTAGDFYTSRWGVEQTNVEFYEVTRATERCVWLRVAEEAIELREDMTYRAVPRPGGYRGREFRRKLHPGNKVRIGAGEWASPWEGEPVRGSTYA